MKTYLSHLMVWIVCILIPVVVIAQEVKKEEEKQIHEPRSFVSKHEGRFGNQDLKYTTTAEELFLRDDQGNPVASIWSVSYTSENQELERPVTFIFNGGPGSASVWLHMGLFGPKLVGVPSEADADDGSAPFKMMDNPVGLLDITDLVFIDPVGTGYSIVVGKGKTSDYWGLNEDARSIAKFIRLWITANSRWNSPKYIAGESFGTTRAAAVTAELGGGGQDMAINGLILISQALDYQGSTSVHDNMASFLTYLPSMAATAWYHKKAGAGKTLASFLEEARNFAYDEYGPALLKGSLLNKDEEDHIASRLAYFTGLDKNYVMQSDLRILMSRFQKELLRKEGLTLGRLDGRYTGEEADRVAERPTLGDAASYSISSAYTAALNHYLSSELKVQMDRPYLTSNRNIGRGWRWRTTPDGQGWEPSYVNVARKLGDSMRKNRDMEVMVANGYYDLITPFFDAEYTFARHGIPMERVSMKYFAAGHMMYTHQEDLLKLGNDIRSFFERKVVKP